MAGHRGGAAPRGLRGNAAPPPAVELGHRGVPADEPSPAPPEPRPPPRETGPRPAVGQPPRRVPARRVPGDHAGIPVARRSPARVPPSPGAGPRAAAQAAGVELITGGVLLVLGYAPFGIYGLISPLALCALLSPVLMAASRKSLLRQRALDVRPAPPMEIPG